MGKPMLPLTGAVAADPESDEDAEVSESGLCLQGPLQDFGRGVRVTVKY